MKKESEKEQIDKIEKAINEALGKAFNGVALDAEDHNYIMAKAMLHVRGLELVDSDVYQGGKNVGKLESVSYDGSTLDVTIQWFKPFHYIICDIEVDAIKVLKKDE